MLKANLNMRKILNEEIISKIRQKNIFQISNRPMQNQH